MYAGIGENSLLFLLWSIVCGMVQVMDDMKKMKSGHVKVVDNIQEQYKTLEDDIQVFTSTFWCILQPTL